MNIPELDSKTFLLLETSELECGVALYQAGKVILQVREQQPRKHGDILLGLVESVLKAAQIKPADLSAIAIVNGPGAFTGIRIGVAMAQGLAYGWDLPCIAVNALDLWALSALNQYPAWDEVMCMMDARMGEVYFAHYKRSHNQLLPTATVIVQPCCIKPEEIDFSFQSTGSSKERSVLGLIGSGALVYREKFRNALPQNLNVEFSEKAMCYSSFGLVAQTLFQQGQQVAAVDLDALYLRAAVTH